MFSFVFSYILLLFLIVANIKNLLGLRIFDYNLFFLHKHSNSFFKPHSNIVLFLCIYVVKFRNKHHLVFYEYKRVCHLNISLFEIPRKQIVIPLPIALKVQMNTSQLCVRQLLLLKLNNHCQLIFG